MSSNTSMTVECTNPDHNDLHASAIYNADENGIYPAGSTFCFGCKKWSSDDLEGQFFNSLKDMNKALKLLNNRDENIIKTKDYEGVNISESFSKNSHNVRKVLSKNNVEIVPFKQGINSNVTNKLRRFKSREDHYGFNLMSYVKDNETKYIGTDGIEYFPNKIPKIANDTVGSHMSVKIFQYNGRLIDGKVKMSDGFYNIFSVDSDEPNLSIIDRAKDICKTCSVNGFWMILNNGNNKFQAGITLSHSVFNSIDSWNITHVAGYANNVAGDDFMNNSFMKNPKSIPRNVKNETDLNFGAQQTITYGFDINLQKSYEEFVLLGKDITADIEWNNVWAIKIKNKTLNVKIINDVSNVSDRYSTITAKKICLIVCPTINSFKIQNDKTWAQPIETIYKNTIGTHPACIVNDKRKYLPNDEYSDMFINKNLLFNTSTAILRDTPLKELESLAPLMDKYIRGNTTRFQKYYSKNPNMHVENFTKIDFSLTSNINRITGTSFFDTIINRDNENLIVSTIKRLIKQGKISLTKQYGFEKEWNFVCQLINKEDKILADKFKNASNKEKDMLRQLFPIIEANCYYTGLDSFNGIEFDRLPIKLKQIISIATEIIYHDVVSFYPFMIKSVGKEALDNLKRTDFMLYHNFMLNYLVGDMLAKENITFNELNKDLIIIDEDELLEYSLCDVIDAKNVCLANLRPLHMGQITRLKRMESIKIEEYSEEMILELKNIKENKEIIEKENIFENIKIKVNNFYIKLDKISKVEGHQITKYKHNLFFNIFDKNFIETGP